MAADETPKGPFLTIADAGEELGVSVSTIWRRIRRGALPSVRRGGRRLIPRNAIERGIEKRISSSVPPFSEDHPIFRLVGAGRSGGTPPGARDKYSILAE